MSGEARFAPLRMSFREEAILDQQEIEMAKNEMSIEPIRGTSMAINNQRGDGCQKPNMGKGNDNPGGTKPPKPDMKPAPIPTK